MSELTISAAGFIIQPVTNLRDGPCELRWWYSRSFLDSDGVQVQWGTGKTGFYIPVPCAIADGLITVEQDSLLWTTDDAQDPNPGSLFISAGLFTSRGQLIQQLMIAGKAQWVVPVSLAPTTTWENFSAYNQAVFIANPPPVFYTAPQIDALVDRAFDEHPASDTELGTVLLTVPAGIPASPVVWGANDPLVRDATKIQGVDVSVTPPLDTQVLTFNQANNQYEPANTGGGSGNVISNEVVSVDSELTLFSGTGGKTIKRGAFTGILQALSGVVSAAVAAVDYVAPGLITASGLTQSTARLLGRTTASTGAVEEITVGTGLSLAAGTLSNTVTDTGITQLTGDVTAGPGSGSQAGTIPNDTVTYAKMQNVSAASRLLGRGSAGGAGDVQEIDLGGGLSMTGTTLSASGTGGYDTVEDEGTPLTQRSTMNFVGAGVTAADAGGKTVVTIPGGGGGGTFEDIDILMTAW